MGRRAFEGPRQLTLFITGHRAQRASLSCIQPSSSHKLDTQSWASCVCSPTSRAKARVGSGFGAHVSRKRKAHRCFVVSISKNPSSLQTQLSMSHSSSSNQPGIALSQALNKILNCVSIESAHCVIFSSTMHEQMRCWKKERCTASLCLRSRNSWYSLESRKRWHSSTREHGSVRRSCSSKVILPST